MLVDRNPVELDPASKFILGNIGSESGLDPQRLAEGIYQITHFNGNMEFGINDFDAQYPNLGEHGCYGVCDSLENLLSVYAEVLNHPVRKFLVTLTKVKREPENKGQGGGWRWHKWGPYIGAHEIQCEYLDDEEGIDHVFCFHVYEIDPAPKLVPLTKPLE